MAKYRILIVLSVLVCTAVYFLLRSSYNNITKTKFKRAVIVTIDTLRVDHLSVYGYPRVTTPFIDSLAIKGVRFNRAMSNIPHTTPSHASMFTGLYPFQHAAKKNYDSLNTSIATLPGLAIKNGFSVAGVPATKFLDGKVGFPPLNISGSAFSEDFNSFWYRNATQVVDRALQWFTSLNQEQKNNYLLWVHFYDVHQWKGDKNIPENYLDWAKQQPQKEFVDFLTNKHNLPLYFFRGSKKMLRSVNGYDARLRYVDDQIKRLYTELSKQDLNKDTVWLITSDHGEGLGNHEYLGHGEFLYNEQLHVPLIIHGTSGEFPEQIVELSANLVDVFPTIADLLNIEDAKNLKLSGHSLLPTIMGEDTKERLLFAERRPKEKKWARRAWEDGEIYAIQSQSAKLIDHSQAEDELYDIESDKFEMHLLDKLDSESMLRDELKKILSMPQGPANTLEERSPEEVEELKTLGYM